MTCTITVGEANIVSNGVGLVVSIEERYSGLDQRDPINKFTFNKEDLMQILKRPNLNYLFGAFGIGMSIRNTLVNPLTQDLLNRVRMAKSTITVDEETKNIYKVLEFLEEQIEYALKNCNIPSIKII